MNREQYLLTKLAEECVELAQITLKTQQFGKDEIYVDATNQERMNIEFNDLLGIVDSLVEEFDYKLQPEVLLKLAKRTKLEKYYVYSKNLGCVQ